MRTLTALVLSSMLMLGGCTYRYSIKATLAEGTVIFHPDGQRLFGPRACITWFTVAAEGEEVWAFGPPASQGNRCIADFPLTYGALPAGAVQAAPPKPIREGAVYVVEARGPGITGTGRFLVRRALVLDAVE
jgi:hypothetical protein